MKSPTNRNSPAVFQQRSPASEQQRFRAAETPHPRTNRTSMLRQSLMKQRVQHEQYRPQIKRYSGPLQAAAAQTQAHAAQQAAAAAMTSRPAMYHQPNMYNMPMYHPMYNMPGMYHPMYNVAAAAMFNNVPMYHQQQPCGSSVRATNESVTRPVSQCQQLNAVLPEDANEETFISASSVMTPETESRRETAKNIAEEATDKSNEVSSISFGTADDIKPDTRALLTLPDAAELQLDEQVQRIRHQIRFCSTQLNELLHLQCTSMQPDFSAESVEPDSFA